MAIMTNILVVYDKIENGERLSFDDLNSLVLAIKNNEIDAFRFVAILAMMETRNRICGIDYEETSNFIRALRIEDVQDLDDVVCTAGTGGDPVKTINVSTAASLVLAAGGVRVLKNGYKSVTGKCGSREILRCLGVDPFLPYENVLSSIRKIGIGYYDFINLIIREERSGFHSPLHYIGALSHPLCLKNKVLGCSDKNHFNVVEKISDELFDNYLISLNPDIDEISIVTPTLVIEKRINNKIQYVIEPKEFNIKYRSYEGVIALNTPEENADFLIDVLGGLEGPAQDLIALNSAAAFYLCKVTKTLKEGFYLSKEILFRGAALNILSKWRDYSCE